MKPCWYWYALLLSLSCFALVHGEDVNGFSVKKVNHEYIDIQGNATDAIGNFSLKARYQKEIESTPRVSGMRFHVMWGAPSDRPISVKLETRGLDGNTGKEIRQAWVQAYPIDAHRGTTVFDIIGESWKKQGKMMAWRATLWQGGQVMAERKSFLWDDSLRTSQKETNQNNPL